MVQFIPIYFLSFRNTNLKSMFAGFQIASITSSGTTSEPGHQLERDKSDEPNGSSISFSS